jgi:uridine kinase
MQEVRLDLLDEHLQQARSGAERIVKPLVVYGEDRITEETVSLSGIAAVVAEGTYTTALENVDTRVFIDLTYLETLRSRLERAREAQDDFLEKVLEIEHRIISEQKDRADTIIDKEYQVGGAG